MTAVGQLVRVEVRPDLVDGFLAIQHANVAASRREPGCHQFHLARSPSEEGPGKPAVFYLWEEFHDQAGLDAHRQTPHFQAWIAWVKAQPDGTVTRTPLPILPVDIPGPAGGVPPQRK